MKNIVIFGAPGSGKGTQSDLMIEKYGFNHISTGDVLRAEIKNGTELGKTAKGYIDNGQLIPDELMVNILASVYDSFGKEHKGVIFDGFPRTIPQAEALKAMLAERGHKVAAMIELDVPEEELMKRLIKRGQESGRSDDNAETIKKRLDVYHNQTAPLIEWYSKEDIHHHNNGLGELVWVKDETRNDFAENKAGYFLTRGLEVKVQGHRAIDDTQATAVYYVKNPQPGEHHVIKLDAKVTGTIGGITIDVVTDFNEVQDDIFVDGLEDSYVDRPDFDGTEGEGGEDEEENNNSIVWEGNELFEPQIISPDSQIQMTITMPAGIETFIVEVSDNFKEAVSVITEGGVDYIDLINDPKIIAEFGGDKSALLTGDEIYHQTEIFFDLSSFVPILSSTAKGMTVDFILNATDVNGQQLLFMGDKPTVTMIIPE